MKQKLLKINGRQSRDISKTPSARKARRSLRSGYAFAHQVHFSTPSYIFLLLKLNFFLLQQEGFGRLITSGKLMRKLPSEFAFPLNLSGKKSHATESEKHNNHNNQNTNQQPKRPNSISILPGSSNSDSSPRAPCQDLDTINL